LITPYLKETMMADVPDFEDISGGGVPKTPADADGLHNGEAAQSALADDHLAAALADPGLAPLVGGFEHVLDQLTVATDLFDVLPVHFDGHSDS
jgi:hypothetical protein